MNGSLRNITCNNEPIQEGDRYVDSPTSCSKQCCLLKIENNVAQRSFSAMNFKLDQSIEEKLRSPFITIDESALHNDVKQSTKCLMY